MNLNTMSELDAVFRHKVIPLLQEYFYEDWRKIAGVLNDPCDGRLFLQKEELSPPPIMPGMNSGEGESRTRYMVKATFNADAFRNIYG